MEIVVSNKASRPLYEQISSQIKAAIMSGELKAGEAIPSVRSLAKSLHISILTVQKAYAALQEDGFIMVGTENTYVITERGARSLTGRSHSLRVIE